MAWSIEIQILDRVVSALRAAWIFPDRVSAFRGVSIAEGALTAIDVSLASDIAVDPTVHATQHDHRLAIVIDIFVREREGESVAHSADPVMQLVHQTLYTDPDVSALIDDLEAPTRQWNDQRLNGGYLVLRSTYFARFSTAIADLAASPS